MFVRLAERGSIVAGGLKSPDGTPPAPDDFALAVNSALTRSQDQFHIHLGCLAPALGRRLPALAPEMPVGAWTRIGTWTRRPSLLQTRTRIMSRKGGLLMGPRSFLE